MKKQIVTFILSLITLIAVYVSLPQATFLLGFSGVSFFAGEIWRIVSFPLVHVSNAHMLENIVALFIVLLLSYEFSFSLKELAFYFFATNLIVAFVTGIIFPSFFIVGASLGLYAVLGALSLKGKEYIPQPVFFIVFLTIIIGNIIFNMLRGVTIAQPMYHAAGFIVGSVLCYLKSRVKTKGLRNKRKRLKKR